MAIRKMRPKRRKSLLWGLADRLTAMIYSFFVNGRAGAMLSSNDTMCKRSFLATAFAKKKNKANSFLRYPEALMERSVSSRTLVFVRTFLASLKLNVYGMFFAFYGLISGIVHIIPAFINGFSSFDEYTVIASGIFVLCSTPLLFSSQSAVEALSNSRFIGGFILNVLCVPKESLKVRKQYGGTVCMFVSSILAMVLGGLSIFTHPLFIPIVVSCLMAVFLVFAFPETGIIITLAALPFMQYLPGPHIVLFIMILITSVSYFCKVFQRKRSFSLSPEITMVMLFCGFIIAGGMFSYGGGKTLADSIAAAVYILGGFLLTYNLASTEKMLSACMKTVTTSFLILCLVGIWESVYNGISTRIIDSFSPTISTITEENILYILDNGVVFGMFAVLVFPMLFAYIIKRKSVQGAAAITVLGVILVAAAWMCSHYEIMAALVIECVIFWFIFSHKTMTAVIFAIIPIGIIAMLYPYAVTYLGWPNISYILMEYMPAGIPNAELHTSVSADVIKMLSDGNLFGMGAGEHAFISVFPSYASTASLGAEQPMSLWLQILCWSGIFGAAAFAVFLVFLMKRSLGFFISAEKKEQRSKALALYCGIVAALLLGCVYGIWVDVRVLYLFWVCTGLLMGYVRVGDADMETRRYEFKTSSDATDVEVVFYD